VKVYQAIAEAIWAERVPLIFSVIGDGNMRFVGAAVARGVRAVYARHENSAIAMADGHARVSGVLGLCSVTLGPGLTTGATSLATAVRHRTPLLVLAGALERGDLGNVQHIDHGRLVEALGARHHVATSADTVIEELHFAFAAARNASVPVVISIPTDIQHSDYEWDVDYVPARVISGQAPTASADAIAAAAHAIRAAERPLILAGRGAVEAGAREALVELAEMIDADLGTTLQAKGLFDGHPRDVGIAGLFASREAQDCLPLVDCVIAVGASLNRYTTEAGALFASAFVICLDDHPFMSLPEAREPDMFVMGDITNACQQLTRQVLRRDGNLRREPAAQTVPRPHHPRDGVVDPAELIIVLNALLPLTQRFVIGAGHFWWFPIHYLRGRPPAAYVFTHDFGAIGQALATGIGASFADGPVAIIEGDVSLMMCMQELDTAVRYERPVLVIVMNDEALGADHHKLRSEGLPAHGALIDSPDLAAIARGLGADAIEARSIAAVRGAVASYLARPRTFLLDVRIDRSVVSEPYRRLYFPNQDG
jgi:acetolactate synthase-1/2/3 large subunit